jgi:flagellum-specific peptidoglycan hydrolase FlgJ
MEATPMKLVGVICTAVLSLTLGVAAPVYAQEQHEQQEEQNARPGQEEKKAEPEKPAKQEERPAAEQEKNTKAEPKQAEQRENNSKQEEKSAQEQHPQAQPGKQAEHATARIPDDRFKANFGEQHRFHVSQADYSRDRRFQYGGYWFGFSQPWPSNWLYTQDVYVIEINGMYYLCNPSYPGVNVALNVTM